MAEETTTEQATATTGEVGEGQTLTVTEQGGTTGTETGTETEARFTQSDVDRIVQTRLSEEKARNQKAIEEGKAAAEKKRLAEQGEWQKLYEEQKSENERLKADVARKDREALCARVTAEAKLPAHWAERLVGETEADLKADAERIAKDLAPPTAPRVDMGSGANGGKPTPAMARERLEKSGDYSGF